MNTTLKHPINTYTVLPITNHKADGLAEQLGTSHLTST